MALIPYLIKTFRGGVSDENDKGVAGSFKHGHSLDIHKRNDSISCKQTMGTIFGETRGIAEYGGTTQTGIINVFVPASDGSLYAFSARGSIWAMNPDGQWTFVYNDPNGEIKGAAEWEGNDGRNYLYWATSSAIARKELPGSNSAPDTGTARWTDASHDYKIEFVSSAAAWHTMKPAAGALYMANMEGISELTFAGDWSPLKMNIRPGNMVNALEERNDFVILGSEREDGSEEGHIWSWTPVAVNYVQKKKIPIDGVNSLIYTELPLLQGGDDGEIFFSDFQNVVPLHGVPGGGRTTPHGVTIEDDLAIFGMYGGSAVSYPGLWSYGRKRKNRPFALNYEYRLSPTINGSTVGTIGAVVNFNGSLIASWVTEDSHTSGTTTEFGVDMVSATTKATAIYEGLEFDAGQPFMKKWINSIKLNLKPLASGTSISAKFKLDNEFDWRYAVLANNTTTFSQVNATEVEFLLGKPGIVYEVGLELNPSSNNTPEVLSITSYLDSARYEHG
jgi:hypothetical protein